MKVYVGKISKGKNKDTEVKDISWNQYCVMILIGGIWICGWLLKSWCYWIRDGSREYRSHSISILLCISVACIWIISSESILFGTLFDTVCQPLLCLGCVCLEAMYFGMDPSVQVYNQCLMLCCVSGSLSSVYVCRDVYRLSLDTWIHWLWFGVTFLTIACIELSNVYGCLCECLWSSVWFTILGLHLFHVLVGIQYLCSGCIENCTLGQSKLNMCSMWIKRVRTYQISSTIQLVYWHFVDCLWLIIYYLLYN